MDLFLNSMLFFALVNESLLNSFVLSMLLFQLGQVKDFFKSNSVDTWGTDPRQWCSGSALHW